MIAESKTFKLGPLSDGSNDLVVQYPGGIMGMALFKTLCSHPLMDISGDDNIQEVLKEIDSATQKLSY